MSLNLRINFESISWAPLKRKKIYENTFREKLLLLDLVVNNSDPKPDMIGIIPLFRALEIMRTIFDDIKVLVESFYVGYSKRIATMVGSRPGRSLKALSGQRKFEHKGLDQYKDDQMITLNNLKDMNSELKEVYYRVIRSIIHLDQYFKIQEVLKGHIEDEGWVTSVDSEKLKSKTRVLNPTEVAISLLYNVCSLKHRKISMQALLNEISNWQHRNKKEVDEATGKTRLTPKYKYAGHYCEVGKNGEHRLLS